ncbi:MAG: copper resistance protein CopC [Tagaea sp.]
MRAAVLAVLLCLWAGAAVAHAVLLETDPGDGARLATPPSSVSLRFNEHVAPIAARLIGLDGAIATLTPSARGYSIDVALPAALAPGGYYLAWRVASADTHPIAGTLAFSVGDGPAAAPISGAAGADAWRGAAILARAVRDVALALGVGGAAFLALVGARRSHSIYVALATAAGATIAGAALAGARLADADPWTESAWNAALATTAGDAMVAILAGVALAALPGRVGPFAGLAAVAIGTALTGHAATAEPRWLFGTAQALHVGAAIFWLGAFWPLSAELRRAPARAARWGVTFSPFGMAAVSLVALGGVALTAAHGVGISVDYAMLVAGKATFLGLMVFLAAENRAAAAAGARGTDPAATARFARNLTLEALAGAGVLVFAAILAHTAPTAGHAQAHAHALAPRADLSLAIVRDGRILSIARTGARLELHLGDTAGAPIDAKEFAVVLSGGAFEALRRSPQRLGPGHYALVEPALTLPATGPQTRPWNLRVEALIDDFSAATFETELRGR